MDYVALARTSILVSGTAGTVVKAFHTEIHRYNERGEQHFANSVDPSIPAALKPVVLLIRGLDDFHSIPRVVSAPLLSDSTWASGGHYLVPGDLETIYDIGPLYQQGINGSGQKIVIPGQTDVYLSDIESFRRRFGLPSNDPTFILVPGSADPGISPNDLIESSLDLEYSGGIAPNATILLCLFERRVDFHRVRHRPRLRASHQFQLWVLRAANLERSGILGRLHPIFGPRGQLHGDYLGCFFRRHGSGRLRLHLRASGHAGTGGRPSRQRSRSHRRRRYRIRRRSRYLLGVY